MSDMTELFMRDPLKLTDSDITTIIEEMRARRVAFRANPAEVKKGRKPSAKAEAAQKIVGNMELDL